jgi:hypothetical protein
LRNWSNPEEEKVPQILTGPCAGTPGVPRKPIYFVRPEFSSGNALPIQEVSAAAWTQQIQSCGESFLFSGERAQPGYSELQGCRKGPIKSEGTSFGNSRSG